MSSELERRLEGMFAEAAEPDPGAGEEALQRALHALQPAAPAHRGLRAAVIVFAAVVVLLVIAAGSLAAAGALHVSFSPKPKPNRPKAAQPLALPPGAAGVAAVVNGRLSVVTQSGFRLQGLPVTTAALSPQALYVAAGIGRSLVAMAPNERVAWSHPAGGRVVAIAWAPDGLRIAYVVHAAHRFVLHVVYGNSKDDTVIDRSVRPVRPSWRADSLAFAYVGAGGRAIVYDLGHTRRTLVGPKAPVTHVAFAPTGDELAVATPDSVLLEGKRIATGQIEALGWLGGRLAVAAPGLDTALIRTFAPDGVPRGSYHVNGIVLSVMPTVVVVQRNGTLVAGHTTLLTVAHGTRVQDLAIG
jgi:hypothetical protein